MMKCECGSTEFTFEQLVSAGVRYSNGAFELVVTYDDPAIGNRLFVTCECAKCGKDALVLACDNGFSMQDPESLDPYDDEYLDGLRDQAPELSFCRRCGLEVPPTKHEPLCDPCRTLLRGVGGEQ